jgi:hypothetical protein
MNTEKTFNIGDRVVWRGKFRGTVNAGKPGSNWLYIVFDDGPGTKVMMGCWVQAANLAEDLEVKKL